MQIEQTFRDLKDHRTGRGLLLSRSSGKNRLNVLLLIAKIADYILMLIGVAGEQRGYQYKYQANSIKHKRILSFVFLGKRMINDPYIEITTEMLANALDYLSKHWFLSCNYT